MIIWDKSYDDPDRPPVSEPVLGDGVIIIGDICYSTVDGSVVWNLKNRAHVSCPTIVVGENAYIAYSKTLKCVEAKTGKELWNFTSKKDKYATTIVSLCAGQDMVFVNSEHTSALDKNGNIVWQSKEIHSGKMAFLTNHLLVTGLEGMFCISPKTGKQLWKSDFKSSSADGLPMAICGTKVYTAVDVGISFPDIHLVSILDIVTGKALGSFDFPTMPDANVAIGAGRVFVGHPWLGEILCYGDK